MAGDYHHGSLERALVAEAVGLAREGGAPAVTVRGAARRAGVSHAAAYRHFGNRLDLLAAVATVAMEELADALEGARAGARAEGRPSLEEMASAYVAWVRARPWFSSVAFGRALWDKEGFPALRRAADRASAPLLAEVGADGAADARELAVAIWSLLHGAAVLARDRQLERGGLSLPGDGDPTPVVLRGLRALLAGWSDAAEGGA